MDWKALAEILAVEPRLARRDARATPLAGGDINRAYRLQIGDRHYFVKLNREALLPMFEAERAGLDALAACGAIRVPAAIATGCLSGFAYIVMEYIEFGGPPNAERLAAALAALHGHCHARFGFAIDNTIGSTPQPNGFVDDWIEFWRKRRLEFQLRLAATNGIDSRVIDAGYRLAADLEPLFGDYRPRASLLHGDLWSGNLAADSAGEPVIFDPACYFGDHETDLAMLELFGSPGPRFFDCYHERFPIDTGYPRRRELYNLYHLLNHANLFGGGYAARAGRMIDGLLASLK